MSGFDEEVDEAFAQQSADAAEKALSAISAAEAQTRIRDQWYASTEELRNEVRDTLIQRRVPRASGHVEARRSTGERIAGWAFPDDQAPWFLDTDANLYTYRLITPSQLVMYFDGRGDSSNFFLTGPVAPDGDSGGLDVFRAEMVRRVVALIPRFEGHTHPDSREDTSLRISG